MEKIEATKKIVKLASYNLFMLPVYTKNQYKDERTKLICHKIIPNFDICCFQEIFTGLNSRRKNIIKAAKNHGLKFASIPPNPPFFSKHISNSGLLTISKYPILETEFIPFKKHSGVDALAYKGVLYSKIEVEDGKIIHVFNTHLQAHYSGRQYTPKSDGLLRARLSQIIQIREIIDNFCKKYWENLKENCESTKQSVILCGDMNIRRVGEFHPLATLNEVSGEYQLFDWDIDCLKAKEWLSEQLKLILNDNKDKIGEKEKTLYFKEYEFLRGVLGDFNPQENLVNLMELNYENDPIYIKKSGEKFPLKFKYDGPKYPATGGFSIKDFVEFDDEEEIPSQEETYTTGELYSRGITIDYIFRVKLNRENNVECLLEKAGENGLSLEVFPNYHFDSKKRFNRLSDHNMIVGTFEII